MKTRKAPGFLGILVCLVLLASPVSGFGLSIVAREVVDPKPFVTLESARRQARMSGSELTLSVRAELQKELPGQGELHYQWYWKTPEEPQYEKHAFGEDDRVAIPPEVSIGDFSRLNYITKREYWCEVSYDNIVWEEVMSQDSAHATVVYFASLPICYEIYTRFLTGNVPYEFHLSEVAQSVIFPVAYLGMPIFFVINALVAMNSY